MATFGWPFRSQAPMFIGHLPAGYVATKAVQAVAGLKLSKILAVGLIASILPDLDLFWFYLVDDRQHVHHSYLFHFPAFWFVATFVFWLVARAMHLSHAGAIAVIALIALQLHMVLDSIAGGIRWLWPFSDREFTMVIVPARYDWWVWNFILHWTFALELLVLFAALGLLYRERKKQSR